MYGRWGSCARWGVCARWGQTNTGETHVLEHTAIERIAIDRDDLVAILELALRVNGAAVLDLDDDIVEGESYAQPILLPLQLHLELEHVFARL